jgi:opacity protein-like surface antigen
MRLLTCMLVVVLLVGAASAATVPTSKGDKAMVFTFHGLNDLDLTGYGHEWGVGMRYYISDMGAIRAGLEFGQDSWTEKGLAEGVEDRENKESSFGLELNYERHLEAACKSVSPYLGAGGGFWSWKSEDEVFATRANPKWTETESGFYVQAIAGFEWGFTECMTLGGEYELGWASGSWKDEYDNGEGSTETVDEEDFSFMGFNTASLFLSVYW